MLFGGCIYLSYDFLWLRMMLFWLSFDVLRFSKCMSYDCVWCSSDLFMIRLIAFSVLEFDLSDLVMVVLWLCTIVLWLCMIVYVKNDCVWLCIMVDLWFCRLVLCSYVCVWICMIFVMLCDVLQILYGFVDCLRIVCDCVRLSCLSL